MQSTKLSGASTSVLSYNIITTNDIESNENKMDFSNSNLRILLPNAITGLYIVNLEIL